MSDSDFEIEFDVSSPEIEATFEIQVQQDYKFERGLTEINGHVNLDIATDEALGGVIVGNDLSITETGILSADIGKGVLTVKANGEEIGTFSANEKENKEINIEIPDSATWGNITGDIEDQEDLVEYVDLHGGKINVVKQNGEPLPIIDKTVNVSVPEYTSELENDGDGESPFATEEYVEEYGGKIDVIQLNGEDIPIVDKTVNIEPEADDIAYENPQYPQMHTLQDAMDKLLYITPTVTLYGGGTYESGSTVHGVNLTWNVNKTITSQSLNQGIGSLDPTLRSYKYEDDITSDKTFTITISDGTTTKTSSTGISFRYYYYWGTSYKDTLTDEDIRGLTSSTSGGRNWSSNSQTLSNREFNCTPTEAHPDGFYAYFVVPTAQAKAEYVVKVNGLPNTSYLRTEKTDYVNASGKAVPMTILRFMKDNPLTTKYQIEVA